MTSLIERIVAIIAPHRCIACGNEDNILCDACRLSEYKPLLPICVMCGAPSNDWRLCLACQRVSGLTHAWVASAYDGIVADVVKKLKFERVKAAYEPLGKLMLDTLPYDGWLIVAIPTAARRIRQRGYDQALLLAQYIAVSRDLPHCPALTRIRNSRQLGTNREQRQKQSVHMFSAVRNAPIKGAKILLIDDVCTTGATLQAAARVLRAAGATQVDAVVAAWQSPHSSKSTILF